MESRVVICVIYARYSSVNQKETSIEIQVKRCKEYAKSMGWKVVFVFADKARSAKSRAGRDGLDELLEAAKSGVLGFTYVLIFDSSRLARNQSDSWQIWDELHSNNCFIYSVSQGIDSSSESASMMFGMNGIVDEMHNTKLAVNTLHGLKNKFKDNFSTGGRKYGYLSVPVLSGKKDRYNNDEVKGYKKEIYKPEANVVLRILSLYAEEWVSIKGIAKILNTELESTGEPLPPGKKKWAASTISSILNSEIYIGKEYYNRTKTKTKINSEGTKVKVAEKQMPSEVQDRKSPRLRIVSDKLWYEVKARQKEVKRISGGKYTKGKAAYSKNLLTGLLKCELCGGNIVIVKSGKDGRNKKYGCSANFNGGSSFCSNKLKIDKSIVEESLIRCLAQILPAEENLQKVHAETLHSLDVYLDTLKEAIDATSVKSEIDEVEKKIDHLIGAISIGGIDKSLHHALQESELRKATLEDCLVVLESPGVLRPEKLFPIDKLQAYFSSISQQLINPETSTLALKTALDKVTMKYSAKGELLLQLFERTDIISKFILDLVMKRSGVIRSLTRTGFLPYHPRVFRLRLHTNLKPTVERDTENIFIERGLYA